MTTDLDMLTRLANRLNHRGTKPSRGLLRQRAGVVLPRDWRDVSRRYLRRFATNTFARWHVGGHHIARIGIGDRCVIAETKTKGSVFVDGKRIALEVR